MGHFPSLRCWVPKGRTWFHRDRGPRVASVHTCVDVCSDPPRTFERGMNTAASLQARQRKNALCCSFIYWWTVHVVTHPSSIIALLLGSEGAHTDRRGAYRMQSQQIEILFRIFISTFFLVLLSAGTLRASPALYTPGRVPMRSNDTLARLPRKKMMPVGKNPLSASLFPWPMGHQQRKRAQRATC